MPGLLASRSARPTREQRGGGRAFPELAGVFSKSEQPRQRLPVGGSQITTGKAMGNCHAYLNNFFGREEKKDICHRSLTSTVQQHSIQDSQSQES